MVCPTRDTKLAFVCEKELETLKEVEETEDVGTKEDDCDGVEHLGATGLPNCVIHHVLTGTKKKLQGESDWQRTNIFHTLTEHEGCTLNVIIDNDSGR